MKIKKYFFYLIITLLVFIIYKVTFKNIINYVPLGDCIAEGINPYGDIGYGYTDYISDYLRNQRRLKNYVNGYTDKNYKINNIIQDIENNKKITINKRVINIRRALRESDLVTISIGLNDLLDKTNDINYDLLTRDYSKQVVDEISTELDSMIKTVKKYAKKRVVIVGYYNPYNNYKYDYIINYMNKKYKTVCSNNDVVFIKISDLFSDKEKFFPNPYTYYPNILGYEQIFKRIITEINV